MIIIVFGLPGSGKSFFASLLAKEINAEYISSDILRKQIFPHRNYSTEEKQKVYDSMLAIVKEAMKQNKILVLDATFYKNDLRRKFFEAAKRMDEVIFIEVQAEEELIEERLQRKRTDSEAGFEVYKKIRSEWEPMKEEHLILQSTNDNINKLLEQALHHLRFKDDKRTDQ